MKRKYYTVLSLLLLGASLMAVSVDVYSHVATREVREYNAGWKEPPPLSVPGPKAVKEMERLDARLASLVAPSSHDVQRINLGLFGYRPVTKSRYKMKGRKMVLPSGTDYCVSLAFSSGTKGFCVINGHFYGKGSYLPDGAQVLDVEPDRVLVKREELRDWIPVAKPKPVTEKVEGRE